MANENRNIENVKKLQNTFDNFGYTISEIPSVVIANESGNGVEIQPCFTKPNRRQTLKRYVWVEAAAADEQIVTVTAGVNIYYVGCICRSGVGGAVMLSDRTTGSYSSNNGETDQFDNITSGSTQEARFVPIPVKANKGIRGSSSAGSGTPTVIVYYIEETIDSRQT